MALVGDLLYPENKEMAREINEKQIKLQNYNTLKNSLVNNYHTLAAKIKAFNGYLMCITSLHYSLVYEQEDLRNLPKTKKPQFETYWTDTIEEIALGVVSVQMGVNGIRSIAGGVSNVVQMGGELLEKYEAAKSAGASVTEAVAKGIGQIVDFISSGEEVLASGTVALLTTEDGALLAELASEVSLQVEAVTDVISEISEVGAGAEELTESTELISETAGAAGEVSTLSSSVSKFASRAAAILGPVCLGITVVTEIIDAIHAKAKHEELEKAVEKMNEILKSQEKDLRHLKTAYQKLVNAGKLRIKTYNYLLPKLKALEPKAKAFNRPPFDLSEFEPFHDKLSEFVIDEDFDNKTIDGVISSSQAALIATIEDATAFIREQTYSDSKMTEIVAEIRTKISSHGEDAINDDYLDALAKVHDITPEDAKGYNNFRIKIDGLAASMLGYHKEIQENTPKGKKAKLPKEFKSSKKPDGFKPKVEDFTIPTIG